MENNLMNLYILNEVLFDYTPGMAVIAAPDLETMKDIFTDEFPGNIDELIACIENGAYQEVSVNNQPEGLISYVYGGG